MQLYSVSDFNEIEDGFKVIPKLVKSELPLDQNWIVKSYRDDQGFLNQGENVSTKFSNELKFLTRMVGENFRVQMEIDGVYFLVAIFFDSNEILVCSQNASTELFILREVEKRNDFDEDDDFLQFREFVNKVTSLKSRHFPTVIEFLTEKYSLVNLKNDKSYAEIDSMGRELSLNLAKIV